VPGWDACPPKVTPVRRPTGWTPDGRAFQGPPAGPRADSWGRGARGAEVPGVPPNKRMQTAGRCWRSRPCDAALQCRDMEHSFVHGWGVARS